MKPYSRPQFTAALIAAELRANILDGDVPPGSRMATTSELVARFRSNNGTIQKALDVLKREGLLIGRQGAGVFVLTQHGLHDLNAGPALLVEILGVGQERPPADVALELGLADEERAVVRQELLIRGDRPIEWQRAYYPKRIALDTALASPGPIRGGAWEVLRAIGHAPDSYDTHVSGRPPTTTEFEMLRLRSSRVPIMRMVKTVRDDTGLAVEVVDTIRHGHVPTGPLTPRLSPDPEAGYGRE